MPVSRRTMTLVSTMLTMSLLRMGMSRNAIDLVLPGRDDFGRTQQLRTDRQAGGPCGLQIDAQIDAVVARDEPDHAALAGKSFRVADRQDAAATEPGENVSNVADFGTAHEKDVTGTRFLAALV